MTATPVTAQAEAPTEAERVLTFWLEEVEPKQWYIADDDLDATIRSRFGGLWDKAAEGALGHWLTEPNGALAYIIVTDQFARNLWRDDPRAFQLDDSARSVAKLAIDNGWDREIVPPGRSSSTCHCIPRTSSIRTAPCGCSTSGCQRPKAACCHARAHREVIRDFGRFPFRNKALGRETSEAEAEWLEQSGYGAVVERLKSDAK
ncbi:LOW QUALITY PROTEIN: putative transmembrane protein [Limimaricola cinnabarinus LL-001]|uniref:Putative transmembrane protein n=1 Tax=Limimaricola cinnabarinus LL-001 TaxID=1337093 RepID=U2Z635_9RHOB|nr:LOW QUALITY PROTEIN: putative transmembrane protein [Limimaricola cinnabarinus LL-001]